MRDRRKRKESGRADLRHQQRRDERAGDCAEAVHQQQTARDHDVVVGVRVIVRVRDGDGVQRKRDGAPGGAEGIDGPEPELDAGQQGDDCDTDAEQRGTDDDPAPAQLVGKQPDKPAQNLLMNLYERILLENLTV